MQTQTLYRPVGPRELGLIAKSGFKEFPPRLMAQPIFYPVSTFEYAELIARDWNVPASGAGYVTRFEVPKSVLQRYPLRTVGSKKHQEYWIPSSDLKDVNQAIIGKIEIVAAYSE